MVVNYMSNSKNNNKKTSEKAKLMSKWQKMPYTNRELSWVDFNARVLEEAFKKTNPIMERCNFLSITASNLDEFFMVRVAGVLDQIHHGRTSRDASGMTPTEVMDGLVEKIHEFAKKQYSCYNRSIIPSLRSAGIVFKEADELDGDQKAFVEEYLWLLIQAVRFRCLQTKALTLRFALQMPRMKNFSHWFRFRQFFRDFLSFRLTRAERLFCLKK